MTRISSFQVLFLLLTVIMLTTISCKEDDDGGPGITDPVEFYSDTNYNFSYTCIGDDIEFFLDVLTDETDNISGEFPNNDIFRIYVDTNNNGVLDSQTDLMYSPQSDGRLCMVSLLSQSSTTGCSYPEGITTLNRFSSTDNSATEHVNFTVTIPKSFLSGGTTAGVVISIYDANGGWNTVPATTSFFTEVLEVSW